MKLAAGIRKHGFRKWYERELLAGHAHMALTFLCVIGFIGALEAASRFRDWADQLTNLFALAASGAIGLWALRRYLYLLMHAEAVAHQADCPGCGTYARFTLVHADAGGDSVGVQCRRCEHRWTIVA
jgi:predicted Zn finger-like uncharacterized protein